jgi:superfamily II DNA or RNA helicase
MKFDSRGLLEPQIQHAIKLCDSLFYNGAAADLSETGIGKTYAAAAIARNFDGPIVVVGPKQILRKWKEILSEYGKEPAVCIGFEKLCRGNTPWLKYKIPPKPKTETIEGAVVTAMEKPVGGDVLTASLPLDQQKKKKKARKFHPDETQQKYFNAVVSFPAGSLVIIDEGHRCKGTNSLQGGFLMSLKRQGYKVLILSATQATSPLDMRAFGFLVNLIESPEMKKYKEFCLDAGAQETGHYGAMVFDPEDPQSQAKMKEIHDYLFNTAKIASRLTREDMGALFPENEIIVEAYDMGNNSDRIQHAYDIMEKELVQLEKHTANYSAHVFAVIMKMRRRVEMLKIPTMVEMIEDLYEERKSVVAFVNFTDTIETIKARLEHSKLFRNKDLIGLIYGERTMRQRDADIDAFQADKKRIMLVNIACAESIGLHDITGKYPRATIVNPSFSAIKVLQALGRVHRQGGKTKSYQRLVFADRTYENHICSRLQGRLDNIGMLNDGDLTGGMDWFRFAAGKDV